MRLIFAIVLFFTIACGKPKPKGATHATTPNTNAASPITPPPPVRIHGTTKVVTPSAGNAETEKQIYVFKYSGKINCLDATVAVSLTEMESQLTGLNIPIHKKYKAEDGKEYSGECYHKTGEINVYVIDESHLQLSESKGGFCLCVPDPGQSDVCKPYDYAPPPPACGR